jgi:hypothetical protein
MERMVAVPADRIDVVVGKAVHGLVFGDHAPSRADQAFVDMKSF